MTMCRHWKAKGHRAEQVSFGIRGLGRLPGGGCFEAALEYPPEPWEVDIEKKKGLGGFKALEHQG